MDQGPLFRRQFFVQPAAGAVPETEAGSECLYVRLAGSPSNPGVVLAEQRVFLSPGGTLDVVSAAHGGAGLGNVTYTPGLRAALKRRADQFVYRFEVPVTTVERTSYVVAVHGHDQVPAFRFAIEVGRR